MAGLQEMQWELPDLMQWLGYEPPVVELHKRGSEDYKPEPESYEMIFTSPPYGGHEKYSDEESQSCRRFSTNELWLSGFMQATLENCHRGLKRKGVLALNIADSSTYPTLTKDVLALATKCGFKLKETLKLALSATPGTRKGSAFKYEPIYVFSRSR
jgi:DNA modification methylase